MSTEFTPDARPFLNRGLHLDRSASELQDGEYQELTNLLSIQEGSLTVRNGNQRLTTQASYPFDLSLIHSIAKLRVSDNEADNRYYIGDGGFVFRGNGPLPAAGAGMAFTQVGSNAVPPGITDYTKQRFTAIQYNAGSVGKPWELIACPGAMFKDDGSQPALQQWGIFPPTRPAIVILDALTTLPGIDLVKTGGGLPLRVNTTITSLTGSAPGEFTITPVSMAGVVEGMMIEIGGSAWTVVDSVTPTTFNAFCAVAPSPGDTIASWEVLVPGSLIIPAMIDASFDGVAADGFSTDDVVHVGVYVSDASAIKDMRIRVLVNGSVVDYYEKSILPSSLQPQASVTQDATTTLQDVVPLINQGVFGNFDILQTQAQAAKAAQLGLGGPAGVSSFFYTEIDIPKSDFLPIGLAGAGAYTWKNVTAIQFVFTLQSAKTATVRISSLYIAGGFGPNAVSTSATIPRVPYSYLVTYRNPVTNQESNPSIPLIDTNTVTPLRQRVAITCHGTSDPQIPTAAGSNSIAVYRSGGLFADGLFRLVGYADNPGGGADVVFRDTQSDTSIEGNDTVDFDNYPPVFSSLSIPFRFGFGGYTSGTGLANALSTWIATIQSGPSIADIARLLTPGNQVTIHGGTQFEEQVMIENVAIVGGQLHITTFFQMPHDPTGITAATNFLAADSVAGHPANLACPAFDSVFIAGNLDSPHTLYQSKVGQPESFPLKELASGIIKQINVGSPSNPIKGITEFGGELICLNLSAIFSVLVFGGAMQSPVKTQAQRGVAGTYAWCKTDNEIWYLSFDGIYSWSGGQSIKRSQPLEPLFRGKTVGQYKPFDMTQFDKATFSYYQNCVLITYIDITGHYQRLRFDLIHGRWELQTIGDALLALGVPFPDIGPFAAVAGQMVEEDTGRLLITKSIVDAVSTKAYLYLDDVGTSDGWVTLPTDGSAIDYAEQGAAFTAGQPAFNKQFADRILELANDNDNISVQIYYDYSKTPDPVDSLAIGPPSVATGRRRVGQKLQDGHGKEAYAVQFRIFGSTTNGITLYNNTFNWFSLERVQPGRAFDWDDLGSPDDKRLYELSIWYDAKKSPRIWTLDVIQGIINNQVVTEDVQDFVLEPLGGTYTGPAWTQVTFPIKDTLITAAGIPNSIVKKIRLRPKAGAMVCTDSSGGGASGGVGAQFGIQNFGVFPGSSQYKVLYDGLNTGKVYVKRRDDVTLEWSDVTGSKVINGGGAPATGVAIAFSNNVIYILYAATGSANPRAMTISRFNTLTTSWLTDITGLPTMDTTATSTGYGPGRMAIAVKPNGNIVILYNGGHENISSVNYARLYRSEYNGTVWSAPAIMYGQAGVAKDFVASQILVNSASASNRSHFIYHTLYTSTTGYEVYHASLPDGAPLATTQLLASDASTRVQNIPAPIGLGQAYTDRNGIERVAIPYIGGGNATAGDPASGPAMMNEILRCVDADVPAWTTEVVDTTTQITGYQAAFEVLCSVAYNAANDGLYMFWVSPTAYGGSPVVTIAGRVLYSRNSGSGWSTPVVGESFPINTVPSGIIGQFPAPGQMGLLVYTVGV